MGIFLGAAKAGFGFGAAICFGLAEAGGFGFAALPAVRLTAFLAITLAARAGAFLAGFAPFRAFGATVFAFFFRAFEALAFGCAARFNGRLACFFACFRADFLTFVFDAFLAMTPFSSNKSSGNWFDLYARPDG